MFDIHVFTYNRTSGKEESDLAGVYSASPARHAARGREKDLLVMLLNLDEPGRLSTETQQEMLEKLAAAYYKTKGTVTHALKVIADQMNERLLARNLRLQRDRPPVMGIFSAAVLHGSTLFIAHAGPTHTFVLTGSAVQHYSEETGGSRGLGISKSIGIRYYRSEVQPGDLALLCSKPPASWNEKSLAGSPQLELDQMRRRLLVESGRDLRFVILRISRGKGEIQTTSLARAAVPSSTLPETRPVEGAAPEEIKPSTPLAEPPPAAPIKTEPSATAPQAPPMPLPVSAAPPEPSLPVVPPMPVPVPVEEPPDFPPHLEPEDQAAAGEKTSQLGWGEADFSPQAESLPSEQLLRRRRTERRARQTVSTALRGGKNLKEKVSTFFRRFLPRILPGQAERLPALSPAAMIFIAIAVPLVIVAAASTAYIQNGRTEQHRIYLAQAQTLLDQANAQSDATLRRVNMDAALEWIDKAETYGISEESTNLRNGVQTALDQLDGIKRLDLQLALPGGFDTSVRITRIIANQAEDLFMLDSATGRVFRLIYTRPGYEVDNQFVCGPGMIGGLIIGPLVDIAAAPLGNNFDASIIGVDEFGNILYCSLTSGNTLAISLPPPDAGWGKIKAISVEAATMHVLDIGSNAVWRFEGFLADYANPPRLYFDSEVPDLTAAIDLISNRDELFILNQDGHIIHCTYSNVYMTPTRCENPYPYQVSTAGQNFQELVSLDANFERIQLTQPPEPSIYFLDTRGPAIYQFSLVLNFVNRMVPSLEGRSVPPSPPSAFVITNGRNLVLAFGNQIYSSPLPAP